MKIGEIMASDREITLNEGKKTVTVMVANKGDRPVQVGSHFHFFEVNRCLSFDRETAYGYHLDIPSGTSVRFEPGEEKEVACVVSGGNIDVNILNRVITRGLVMSGRKANMTIALEDRPGQLKKVAEIVSRCGSNVVSVQHDGSDPNMPISSCFLKLTLETRDAEQIEQIRAELAKEGFQLVSERV